MSIDLSALYQHALPSFRSGIFYNTYAYPTKIAPESIAVFIAAHTKPGDTVLDVFSGSGTTGLAAQMCEHPTADMLRIAEKLGVEPLWGPRNAVLYDISTYGTFASRVMTNPPNASEFADAAERLLRDVEAEVGQLYQTVDAEGNTSTLRHVIWSNVLTCSRCGREFTFYDGMVSWNPLRIKPTGTCPHCGCSATTTNEFATETVFDGLLGTKLVRRKRVPVLLYGETDGRNWRRAATPRDLERIEEIEAMDYPDDSIAKPIEWGELHRSGYHRGISHLHHFYTKRNYLVFDALWRATANYGQELKDALRLFLLSYNATHSTLMTRVVAKQNSSDFILSGAQSGVLYVSNLPVEKNIFKGLSRKIKPFARAFSYVNTCTGHVEVRNQSSSHLEEATGTIDYIFTDPPFGDFIPYAEVNQINELWLGDTTNRADEAIISQSQSKDVTDYGALICESFREARRVLAHDGAMTIVFHASKANVWQAFASALEEAELHVETTSHLERAQDSFKQVVSAGSVKHDSLILVGKAERMGDADCGTKTSFDLASGHDGPQEAYTAYVNHCLQNGMRVELDARDAYREFALSGVSS